MSPPRRILAVDDDPAALKQMQALLSASGLEVAIEKQPSRVVTRAGELQPDLVLVERNMPLLSGAEVIRALRAFPQTAALPVAFLSSDLSGLEVLRALRSGAVDLLPKPLGQDAVPRLMALLEEVSGWPANPGGQPHQRVLEQVLAFFRRARRSTAFLLNPGTPFEGRARFEGGELVMAEYGPVKGSAALGEMLWVEDGVWRVDEPTAEGEAIEIDVSEDSSGPGLRPLRVLFVDDEPELRKLFSVHLARAGFQVELAGDGEEGFKAALASAFDVIIADLNMPRLDGWGLLRLLKTDHRTREVPVFFLSAHDDYRETLRAAHAGAHDYLSKSGRAEVVVNRAMALVSPRLTAERVLKAGKRRGAVEVSLVGPQWILRTLRDQRATGRFEAKDDWGQYAITFRDGEVSEAHATTSTKKVSGVPALAAFIVSRGARAGFFPGPVGLEARFGVTTEVAIERACETLNALEARVAQSRLASSAKLVVDEELYRLFLRIASDRDLVLARAVCEQKVSLAQLPQALGMPPEDVQAGLRELLRRRVIGFEEG